MEKDPGNNNSGTNGDNLVDDLLIENLDLRENSETTDAETPDETSLDSENSIEKKTRKEISYETKNMLSFQEVKELDEKYILQTYARMPIHFAYGSGEFLYDENGKEYIDFLSGIAVTNLGHAHADLVDALTYQADLLWHTSNLFYNQQQALLARALVEITFPGRVFFCNSGAEANEASMKAMRAWGASPESGKEERQKIIALKGGFHGRTFGAMSITGQSKIQDGFGALLEDIEFIEPNDVAALEAAVDEDTCGVIMELIQGEGGVIPLDPAFVIRARELCDEKKALFAIDEIQTGMGRTGKYFAFQQYGVLPDLLSVAKGLGGGFPIGALVVAEPFQSVLQSGMHGSTFGGSHLAAAVGYEVIRIMEANKTLENVEAMSDYILSLLKNLQAGYPEKVKEIRGMGLLIGIVLNDNIAARPLVAKALEKNLVVGRAGENVIRLAPPLNVRQITIDRAIERLEELIRNIEI